MTSHLDDTAAYPAAPAAPQTYPYPSYSYPSYPQPGAGAYPPARPQNPLALVSLILTLSGMVIGGMAIGGIVCGHIARREIRRTGESGDGLALAGLIGGYVIVVSQALVIVVVVLLYLVAGIAVFTAVQGT